ncbi:MAG: phosphopantetheine-binding protein, partial [Acidobacteriota bacterium]|nr:phosphopantetheine-binding protein [Acidobacteriota bacterium]
AAFVFLRELPLTPNGKVDRAALTAPDLAARNRNQSPVAPRTPIEEVIASIWVSVLRLEHVGIDDDFFELGGHSLKAAQVVSRVGQAFGLDLSLRSLFEAPTVGLFASRVEEALLDDVERDLPAEASVDGHGESTFLGGKAILD